METNIQIDVFSRLLRNLNLLLQVLIVVAAICCCTGCRKKESPPSQESNAPEPQDNTPITEEEEYSVKPAKTFGLEIARQNLNLKIGKMIH